MKYYIATTLSRAGDHNIVRDGLNQCGHEIVYDWTSHGSVKSTSKERLREVCLNELKGLSNSDFVAVLLPGGHGTHLELGFSLASGKRVFLHSEDPTLFEIGPQTNAFYHHPEIIRLTCPLIELAAAIHGLMTSKYFAVSDCQLKNLISN